jgi:hypothetical protein
MLLLHVTLALITLLVLGAILLRTISSGKNRLAYFLSKNHVFEVLERNLMELNLNELTLTSFN